MTDIHISIIVPVYNVENYLDICVKSLAQQTYPHFEILLIDDGSTDKSGEICDSWASVNDKISVLHKKNGGVSSARNAGIELSKGDWICFVDADDWVTENYLENFVKDIQVNSYDLIVQSFWRYNETNKQTIQTRLPNIEIDGGNRIVRFLEETPNVHNGFLWHRLFNNKIVKDNNIRFKNGINFGEDGLFFLQYLGFAQKSIFSDKCGYYYRVRENSLTSQGKKLDTQIYKTLLSEYSQALATCTRNKNDTQNSHNSFIRKYLERLINSWFFLYTIPKEYNSIKENLDFIRNLLSQYHIKASFFTRLCIAYLTQIDKYSNNKKKSSLDLFKKLLELRIKIHYKIITIKHGT